MASSIQPLWPEAGTPTTQSVRDNFQAAKDEIEALQTDKANLASPTFTGTVTAAALTASGTVNFTGTFQLGGVAVSATAAELNKLDGTTAVLADFNKLAAITATAAEINILDGVVGVNAAEISYLANVSSDLQTQLDAKAPVSTTVTLTGAQTVADKTLTAPVLDRPTEGVVALGAGTALDMSAGSIFQKTFTGNTTLTLSNVPASGFFAFAIEMTNAGAHTVTFSFGGTIQWPGGTEPSWSASGTDTVTFYTTDGGSTFRANVFGQAWA